MSAGKKAVLLLADGTKFTGRAIGKIGTTSGEICFNTGMTGYQEIYTDPSYYGQILVNTTSHIGNYGTIPSEDQSDDIAIKGLVVKDFSEVMSRAHANKTLQEYLVEHELVGISDIDTRYLVQHIRINGAMNGVISSEDKTDEELKAVLAETPNMEGLELSSAVTTKERYTLGSDDSGVKVAVLDVGVKKSILNHFVERGAKLEVFPAKTTAKEIIESGADGFFISNGPGDPAVMDYAIDTVKELQDSGKPIFGICMGHQLIGLANGATTYKLHHGHRGCNHPVKNLETGLCEVTSQNHGFSVDLETAKNLNELEITHMNLNDNTVAGLKVKGKKVMAVQYHPESAPGPNDSKYLFDNFLNMIKEK
jgi:carbamoyl-phosphate synthase small subunit